MARLEFFRQQAPEFANLADETVNAWFATALVYLDSDLGKIPAAKLELAIALYAAHLCWLNKYPGQGGASRGPIMKEKDDRMGASKDYALLVNSDSWLGQSFYGQSFSDLTGIFSRSKTKAAILTRFGTNPSFLP